MPTEIPKRKPGRPKGSRSHYRKILGSVFGVDQVFSDEMERDGWHRLLSSGDDRIFVKGFALALSYKRGLPKQELKHTGVVAHILSPEDRAAALAIIEKLRASD